MERPNIASGCCGHGTGWNTTCLPATEAATLTPAGEAPGLAPKSTWQNLACSCTLATPRGLSMGFQGKEKGLVRALGSDTGPRPPSKLQEELGRYCPRSDLLSCPADRPSQTVLNEWWPSVARNSLLPCAPPWAERLAESLEWGLTRSTTWVCRPAAALGGMANTSGSVVPGLRPSEGDWFSVFGLWLLSCP